jgi:hypothetical protein
MAVENSPFPSPPNRPHPRSASLFHQINPEAFQGIFDPLGRGDENVDFPGLDPLDVGMLLSLAGKHPSMCLKPILARLAISSRILIGQVTNPPMPPPSKESMRYIVFLSKSSTAAPQITQDFGRSNAKAAPEDEAKKRSRWVLIGR